MSRRRRGTAHGTTLIEVMVAMSVLFFGLLGMMRLQIWGLNSNQGARANTIATQLGRELASGLERLPFHDPRLAATASFGGLLQADGTVPGGGFTPYAPVPGVRDDAALPQDELGPVYQRRWTVSVQQAAGQDAIKIVAVSVVFRERGIQRPKEVVVYAHNVNRPLLTANLPAY
jgi:type IV pilus assembly protein PilV